MELVKWRYRSPYHDRRHERERMFVIGGHTIAMDQEPSEDIGLHQKTGFLIWDGAYLMAKFIAERVTLAGKSCLELGARSALVSIVAHLQGAGRVVATDLKEYQEFMRRNIERNTGGQSIEMRELIWGSDTNDIGKMDYVFGSEILYLADQHHALLDTLQAVMHARTTAYFVYKERGLGEEQFAALALERGLKVRHLSAFLDDEFTSEPYHLFSLRM